MRCAIVQWTNSRLFSTSSCCSAVNTMLLRSILFHLPLCVQKILAKQYNLVTAILREVGNMCVRFRDAEPDAQPCVSIPFAHEALFPELVKGAMRLHPFLPQFLVGKRSHWKPRRLVCLHISIAGRIPGADIELRRPVYCVAAINTAGRTELRRRVAVWAKNSVLSQMEILLCITQKEEGRVSVNSSFHRLTSTS